MSDIHFGTDGWRAIISDTFTFGNVKVVAQSIADYVRSQKAEIRKRGSELYGKNYCLVVGYDTRFLSEKYAEIISCVLAGNGIPVILADRPTPTPSVSFTIRHRNCVGGVMVTASHNPAPYNGIKYKGYFGGSIGTKVTDYLESRLHKGRIRYLDREGARKRRLLRYENIVELHMRYVKKFIDRRLLKRARLTVLVDSMNGTGASYIESLLKGTSIKVTTINGHRDPYFGGRSPEPNELQLRSTAEIVKKGQYDLCLVTDGDADRLGVILSDGTVLSGHKVMTLLLLHLLEHRRLRGGVVQTICGTGLIDKIAEEYGLPRYETPVGFKYIGELYITKDVVLGGEETGGVAFKGWLPERDGILSGLLILEMVAARKQSLGRIVRAVNRKYGLYIYKRLDLKYSRAKKKKLLTLLSRRPFTGVLGKRVIDHKTYDGHKFIREDGSWVMLRPSGTEPKLRVYSEAHSEREALRLIEFGKRFAVAV